MNDLSPPQAPDRDDRCPGTSYTDMLKAVREEGMASIIAAIPVGRLGTPAEVARAVRFLAGEDAGFITGATLALNGGQYLS